MRARRGETPARAHETRGNALDPGAPGARRRWAQSYRALRRAQPGPRLRGTRPTPHLSVAVPNADDPTCLAAATTRPERKHDLATQVAHLDFERAIADVEEQISALRTLARERGLDVSSEIVALERKL